MTKYQTHNANGTTFIEFQGRLVLGDGCAPLQALVEKLLAEGARTIHIDLSEVRSMDGSGIGVLVNAFKQMQRPGAELRLVKLSKTVCRLLHLTKLNTVFSIQGIEEERYDVVPQNASCASKHRSYDSTLRRRPLTLRFGVAKLNKQAAL